MKSIKDMDLSGKKVLVRVDFNVPLSPEGAIEDDARIQAALPTLRFAVEKGAKLIVASHLGRPKGAVVPAFSLAPVAVRLEKLLERNVTLAPDCVGPEVETMVERMRPGEVVLLENLRFHKEEQANEDAFAEALANLCDLYVNDAFAVSHRANASVVGITKYAPAKAAGFLLEKELTWFERAMHEPRRPLVAVIGGAKISSKLAALENMLQHVDKIMVGGAMANTFFRYFGYDVGASTFEADQVEVAGDVYRQSIERGIKFYTPVDVVIARRMEATAEHRAVPVQEIAPGWMALDIGPATGLLFEEALVDAGTILWNGPMGVFEMDPFSRGTLSLARAIAASQAMTVVGGGDTGSAVHISGKARRMSYISTGGGAFLALMEGKPLPAVAALEKQAPSPDKP
ncbi:MAG: phosphoglycerate kinase [Deltaproteobacteria bacterium]|nr:phosphoglycerate kinase [Deltaproteobacteria bacterium]